MANHTGQSGLVKIGTTTLGELRTYSVQETAGTIEDTVLGDSAKTYKAGQTSFSGSCDAFWDENDAGQTAISAGAEIAISFYPEGDAGTYASGNVIVTEIGVSTSIDGMVEVSFSFQGSGALVWTVV